MIKFYSLLISSTLILASCQKEVEIPAFENDPLLVVEGVVSNVNSNSFVRLSTSTNLEGIGENILGKNASVKVVETNSESTFSKEVLFFETPPESGFYKPIDSLFRGEASNKYRLEIVLKNGSQYESSIQEQFQAIPIESISYEYVENTLLDNNGIEYTDRLHNVYVSFRKSSSEESFFRLKARGIAEVVSTLGGQPDENCYSFRNPINNIATVFSTQGLPLGAEIRPLAAAIPFDFRMRYLAQISVLRINDEAFDFWETVSEQQRIRGTIFDPFLPEVRGNITCLDKPDEKVLGFFEVYSETGKEIMIDRSQYGTIPIPLPDGACVDVWAPATYQVPQQFIR